MSDFVAERRPSPRAEESSSGGPSPATPVPGYARTSDTPAAPRVGAAPAGAPPQATSGAVAGPVPGDSTAAADPTADPSATSAERAGSEPPNAGSAAGEGATPEQATPAEGEGAAAAGVEGGGAGATGEGEAGTPGEGGGAPAGGEASAGAGGAGPGAEAATGAGGAGAAPARPAGAQAAPVETRKPRPPPIRPPRLGGTEPRRVDPPPRMPERAQREVLRRTGLSADEHHDRVRADVQRLGRIAHDGQLEIVREIDAAARDLPKWIRREADGIPRFVGGLIKRIERHVARLRGEVDRAADQLRDETNRLVDLTGQGLDQALEMNRTNVLASLAEASGKVSTLYADTLSPAYHDLASRYGTEMRAMPRKIDFATAVSDATAAWAEWPGAEGEPATAAFKAEQKSLDVQPTSEDVYAEIVQEAEGRAQAVEGPEAEASFALGVLAMVDPAAVVFPEQQEEAEGVCREEQDRTPPRLATPRERALARIEGARTGAHDSFDHLLEESRKSLWKAASKAREDFRTQAVEAEHGLRGLAPDMATSWRTWVRQLDPVVPPGQLLDHRRLGPQLLAHEARGSAMLEGQKKVVADQEKKTREGVTDGLRELRKSLRESAAEITSSADDIRGNAFRRLRLAREALAPFRAFEVSTLPLAETWASATDKELDDAAIARITKQAKEQLTKGPSSIEVAFFQDQRDTLRKNAEKKRDSLKPGSAEVHPRFHEIDGEVEQLLADRAEAIRNAGEEKTAIFFSSTDEDGMLTALAGFTPKGMKALEEEWSVRRHWGSLRDYVLGELDDDSDEKAAGRALLDGDTVGALDALGRTDLKGSTREAVALMLTSDDLKKVEQRGGWGATAENFVTHTEGTSADILRALMRGNRQEAGALRLEMDAQSARSSDDVTKTLDVASSVDRTVQRYMSPTAITHASRAERDEFTRTALVAHAELTSQTCLPPDMPLSEARQRFATHLTRTFETEHTEYTEGGGSYTYTVEHKLKDEDVARVVEVVTNPTGLTATAIRGANAIRSIDGEANDRELVTLVNSLEDPSVLHAQRELDAAERSGDKERIQKAKDALASARSHHAEYLRLLAEQLGADEATLADPERIRTYVTDKLRGVVGHREGWGDEFARTIIEDGRVGLTAATMVGTQGGTNEDLLFTVYEDRTWAEIDAARADFRTRSGEGELDSHLGVFGGAGWGAELSGEDRQRLERIMVLDAGSDRGIAAAGRLSNVHAMENGFAGRAMMDGTPEERSLSENNQALEDLIESAIPMGAADQRAFDEQGRPNPAAFDAEGRFLGDRDRLQAFGIRAESRRKTYDAAIDRTVNMITGLIQALATLVAAIVLIVATLVPGVNVAVWLAVGALVAGLATIAVKACFKGGRYGWEEMLVDVGTTAIDTALAFAGGRGAAAMMRQGIKQNIGIAVRRGAIMGFAGSAGHAALQDKTWENGLLSGFGNVVLEGGIGAVTGAATEFLSVGIGNALGPAARSTGLRAALTRRIGSGAHNVIGDAIGDTIGQFAGSLVGTGLHAATGSYHGSFLDALGEAGFSALAEAVASPLRAKAFKKFNAHYGARTRLADSPHPPTPEQVRRLYQEFRNRGDTQGQTFEQFAAHFAEMRAGIQARRATAIGDLPPALRAQYDAVPVETLEAMSRLARGEGDPDTLRQALMDKLWEETDGRMTRSELEKLADDRLGAWHATQEKSVQYRQQLLDQVPEGQRETLGALSTASLARALDLAGTEAWTPHERLALLKEARARRPSTTAAELFRALDQLSTSVRAERQAGAKAERTRRGALLAHVPPAQRGPLARLPVEGLELAADLIARGSFGTAEERAKLAQLSPRGGRPGEVLRALDAAVAQRTPVVADGPVRAAILGAIPPHLRAAFEGVPIEILPPALFRERTGSRRGKAVVVFEDGRPKVLVRSDAELSVLHEEGIHLLQAGEPGWRGRIGQLDEARLHDWGSLSIEEQAAIYRVKLEVEIDAQQRLVAELAGDPSVGAQRRRSVAEATLDALNRRLAEVDSLSPARVDAINRGEAARPQYLQEPPRLFAKDSRRVRAIEARVADARATLRVLDDRANAQFGAHATEPAGTATHAGRAYPVENVRKVFGVVTLGAGFAAVANVVTRGFSLDSDLMLAAGPNPWDTADPSVRLGQTSEGGVGLPNPRSTFADVVADPGAQHYAMAREHGDHVAVNRAAVGVPVTRAQVIRVETRATTGGAGWPSWAGGAKARVLVGMSESGPYRWVYAESVDLALGPGPGRRPTYRATRDSALPNDLVSRLRTEDNKPVLRMSDAEIEEHFRNGRLLTADQGTTVAHLGDGEISIIGGGASGAWIATMAAIRSRRNPSLPKVEWVGVIRDIAALRSVGGTRGAELMQSWVELMTTGRIADPAREADLKRWAFEEAPQNGALKRNRDAEAEGIYHPSMREHIDWTVQSNLQKVEWDGSRFVLTYENGVVVRRDQVVFAVGQDPTAPGAVVHVLDPALRHTLDVMRDANGDFSGLTSPDGALRLLGMAGTMADSVKFGLRADLADEALTELRDTASRFQIDSRGVVGGFHHARDMIGAANAPHIEALQAALPRDLGGLEVVPAALPVGVRARVRYEGDRVWIEVGPHTTPRDIAHHARTVRMLQRYTGWRGRIRRVIDRIWSFASGRPRYGTRGFEARLEVEKLRAIDAELRQAMDLAVREGRDTALLEGRLSENASRIAEFESAMDSLEAGRGWIASGARDAHVNALAQGLIAPPGHYWRESSGGVLHLVTMEGVKPAYTLQKVKIGSRDVEWPMTSTGEMFLSEVFDRYSRPSDAMNLIETYLQVIRDGNTSSATHKQRADAALAEAALRIGGDLSAFGKWSVFRDLVDQAMGLDRLTRLMAGATSPGDIRKAIKAQAGKQVTVHGDTELVYPKGWETRGDRNALVDHADALDQRYHDFVKRLKKSKKGSAQYIADESKVNEMRGERATTGYILDNYKGYELALGYAAGTGFDQVWVKRSGGKIVDILVVESKYGTSRLQDTDTKGMQMSKKWVKATAEEGSTATHQEIRDALKNKNPPVRGVVIRVDTSGVASEDQDMGVYNP